MIEEDTENFKNSIKCWLCEQRSLSNSQYLSLYIEKKESKKTESVPVCVN